MKIPDNTIHVHIIIGSR